ncbi:hypothetical protein [Collimonas sp. OK607]|uniref:hypothetical protein n=1 Tax=Collimonas sp. OK607 TaxID=1798194 RepID=UPI00147B4109|nr:hypothetical protein [Collimonas sp. OK607]
MSKAVHRADIDTVGVFATDAGIGDDKRHGVVGEWFLGKIDSDSLIIAVFAPKTAANGNTEVF